MFTKFALASVVGAAVVGSVSANCTRNYTVVEGDICDSISASQGVSTYQLAASNFDSIDSTCSNLAIGQELCLGWPGYDCTETYTVAAGDTCDSIASASGINTTTLALNNPQIDSYCSNIYIGEVLAVCSTVTVAPHDQSDEESAAASAAATWGSDTPAAGAATVTPAPASTTETSTWAAPTSTASYDGGDNQWDDEDDEDLPWCDEL